eukprot:TRINITY_DN6762_c0_g1_i1.p1 TRINITY_DN6762_c0_g1~~TRINITY_DN6762_c0_g1_i1.p1  ORF type:complete len:1627 (-),score=259.91 TRINITY_DN6762_c0_g1_i1:102-4982(-)
MMPTLLTTSSRHPPLHRMVMDGAPLDELRRAAAVARSATEVLACDPLDECDARGQSLLHVAADKARFDVAEFLLSRESVNLNVQDKTGYTPLHAACFNGDLDVIGLLLVKGADVYALAKDKSTPLHLFVRHRPPSKDLSPRDALIFSDDEEMSSSREASFDSDSLDSSNYYNNNNSSSDGFSSPLLWSPQTRKQPQTPSRGLPHSALNTSRSADDVAFQMPARSPRLRHWLKNSGGFFDKQIRTDKERTELYYSILRQLIGGNATRGATTSTTTTTTAPITKKRSKTLGKVLFGSSESEDKAASDSANKASGGYHESGEDRRNHLANEREESDLFESGPFTQEQNDVRKKIEAEHRRRMLGNTNARNKNLETPIFIAASARTTPHVLVTLLRYNADLSVTNRWGETVLHMAVRSNSSKNVIMLLEWGADPNVEGKQGTPLDLARAAKSTKLIPILESALDKKITHRKKRSSTEVALSDSFRAIKVDFSYLKSERAKSFHKSTPSITLPRLNLDPVAESSEKSQVRLKAHALAQSGFPIKTAFAALPRQPAPLRNAPSPPEAKRKQSDVPDMYGGIVLTLPPRTDNITMYIIRYIRPCVLAGWGGSGTEEAGSLLLYSADGNDNARLNDSAVMSNTASTDKKNMAKRRESILRAVDLLLESHKERKRTERKETERSIKVRQKEEKMKRDRKDRETILRFGKTVSVVYEEPSPPGRKPSLRGGVVSTDDWEGKEEGYVKSMSEMIRAAGLDTEIPVLDGPPTVPSLWAKSAAPRLNRKPSLIAGPRAVLAPERTREEPKTVSTEMHVPCSFSDEAGDGAELNKQFQDAVSALRRLEAESPNENAAVVSANDFSSVARATSSCDDVGARRLKAYYDLVKTVREFERVVRTCGELIINETGLPLEQKTLAPINGSTDEEAIFIVKGIEFQFVGREVRRSQYSGITDAKRSANNESSNMLRLFSVINDTQSLHHLHLPLMTTLAYRGFTIFASTFLPVDQTTLKYGNIDEVVVRDDEVEASIEQLGFALNITTNPVTNKTPFAVHISTDGKWYINRFEHLFPPEFPRLVQKKALSRRLRSEAVSAYPTRLCPLAFTPSPAPSEEIAMELYNRNVEQASEDLLERVVPEFAKRIGNGGMGGIGIVHHLRRKGISVRHMGHVRYHYYALFSRQDKGVDYGWHLLLEMVLRVIKGILRNTMRNIAPTGKPATSDHRLCTEVIDTLNLIYGSGPASEDYWQTTIKPILVEKFPKCLAGNETESDFSLFQYIRIIPTQNVFIPPSRGCLFEYLIKPVGTSQKYPLDGRWIVIKSSLKSVGLELSSGSLDSYFANAPQPTPFTQSDLKEIRGHVKAIDFLHYYQGLLLAQKACTVAPDAQLSLHQKAVNEFTLALSRSNADSSAVLRHMANSLSALNENNLAGFYYRRAIECEPNDALTLCACALFLEKCNLFSLAEEYYLKALEITPGNPYVLCIYADFIFYHHHYFDESERFYQRALKLDKQNIHASNNYACLLLKVAQREEEKARDCRELREKAAALFARAALNSRPNNNNHNSHHGMRNINSTQCTTQERNYATFLHEFGDAMPAPSTPEIHSSNNKPGPSASWAEERSRSTPKVSTSAISLSSPAKARPKNP